MYNNIVLINKLNKESLITNGILLLYRGHLHD